MCLLASSGGFETLFDQLADQGLTCLDGQRPFVVRGGSAENRLVGGVDERRVGLAGKSSADGPGQVLDHPAVGQCQRLLWSNRLVSPVAFLDSGRVERFEHLELVVTGVTVVDRPPHAGGGLGARKDLSADGGVEFSRECQQAVPHHLALHPSDWHAAEEPVVGVSGFGRIGSVDP